MSKWKKILWILFIFSSLGILFLHFYAPRLITEIKNPVLLLLKGKDSFSSNTNFRATNKNGKQFHFQSKDGLKLSAYICYSELDTIKGTLILLHGIRSTKEHFIELSQKLSQLGYHTVALDSRAHGQSEGTHCTFGVKEKEDVSQLIDYLNEEEGIHQNIGIWGQSLGGAIALQSMGNDTRIQFGIVESTFTNFESITHDYFAHYLGFSFKFLSNYLVKRAGKIASFLPKEASPIQYCTYIEQPILLVHGSEDKKIDIKYAKENFQSIKSTKKELLKLDKAGHLNLWKIGGEAYFEKAVDFIANNSDNQ